MTHVLFSYCPEYIEFWAQRMKRNCIRTPKNNSHALTYSQYRSWNSVFFLVGPSVCLLGKTTTTTAILQRFKVFFDATTCVSIRPSVRLSDMRTGMVWSVCPLRLFSERPREAASWVGYSNLSLPCWNFFSVSNLRRLWMQIYVETVNNRNHFS